MSSIPSTSSMAIIEVDEQRFYLDLDVTETLGVVATCKDFPDCWVRTDSIPETITAMKEIIRLALQEKGGDGR